MRPTKASTLLHSTLGHGVTNSSVVREEFLTVALLHHLALMGPLLQDTTALPLTTTNTPLTTSMVSKTARRATMKTTTARALPVQALTAKADTHAVVDATAAAAAIVALVDVEVLDLTTGALTTAGLITADLAVTAHANTMALLMTALVAVHEAPTAVLPAHLLTMVPEDLTKDLTAMVLAVTVAHVTTADLDATDPGVSMATSADHVVVAASAGLTQVLSGVQAQALTPPT